MFYKQRFTFRTFFVKKRNHRITFHRYCHLVLMETLEPEITVTVSLATFVLVEAVTRSLLY